MDEGAQRGGRGVKYLSELLILHGHPSEPCATACVTLGTKESIDHFNQAHEGSATFNKPQVLLGLRIVVPVPYSAVPLHRSMISTGP